MLAQLAALSGLLIAVAACGGAMEDSSSDPDARNKEDESLEIVTPGKADNYYSDMAKEYELSGTIGVDITEEDYNDPTERNRVISSRLTAVGLYLTTYLTDKIRGVDSNGNGEIDDDEVLFENMDYGGFKAMVRNYSVENEEVVATDDGSYEVQYTIDVAGPKNFLDALAQNGGERTSDGVEFAFQMPDGATSDPENVDRGNVRDFSPADYEGDLESVELEAAPLPNIQNAYPHYQAFFEDGLYDITLFYGYDYNDSRSDLEDAEKAFETLESWGFEAPVAGFDSLEYDSGPFVKTVQSPSEGTPDEVEIEVRIFHAEMFENEREYQRELALERLSDSDVFFYNGHAGPYYGFLMESGHTADVENYRELAEIEMKDKQQLFVAQGCQTYSQYADMLYANPAKSEENLDVITTVNYSYGRGTMTLLENLVSTNQSGYHQPTPFYEIVQNLNDDFYNGMKDVFYGVMGIDGNPQTHPYGNPDAIGESCEAAFDCGVTNGNVCAEGSCAVRALAEGSCPADSQFGYLGDGEQLETGICYR